MVSNLTKQKNTCAAAVPRKDAIDSIDICKDGMKYTWEWIIQEQRTSTYREGNRYKLGC